MFLDASGVRSTQPGVDHAKGVVYPWIFYELYVLQRSTRVSDIVLDAGLSYSAGVQLTFSRARGSPTVAFALVGQPLALPI